MGNSYLLLTLLLRSLPRLICKAFFGLFTEERSVQCLTINITISLSRTDYLTICTFPSCQGVWFPCPLFCSETIFSYHYCCYTYFTLVVKSILENNLKSKHSAVVVIVLDIQFQLHIEENDTDEKRTGLWLEVSSTHAHGTHLRRCEVSPPETRYVWEVEVLPGR